MKKKLAVLFLASVLALSAAACNSGSSNTESKVESVAGTSSTASVTESKADESVTESKGDESTASSTESNVDAEELIQKNFLDIVKDGKYYMQMTMDTSSLTSGVETSEIPDSLTMTLAADIENKRIYVDMGYSVMGFQKIMIAEGKQWMFDDTNKVAYYTATTEDVQKSLDSMTGSVLGSTDNMTYVSDSVETFNGKECYAVVYNVASDISVAEGASLASSSGLETEQTYYFDKSTNALVGIKVKNGSVESSMVIDTLTNDIPADTFTVPADYTKTDLSSMMDTTSNS